MDAVQVWWHSFRHLEHRGYVYVWANLCFMLLFLPIVTAPAGLAGLVKMSHALHTDRHADLNTFWSGVRENFWRGTFLGLITLCIIIVNWSNLVAYSTATGLPVMIMRLVWISAIVLWLTILLYVWAIYYSMEPPTLWGAIRNAGIMILFNPVFTLILMIGVSILGIISLLIPPLMLLLTFSLLSIVSTRAVLNRLISAGYAHQQHFPISAFQGDQLR